MVLLGGIHSVTTCYMAICMSYRKHSALDRVFFIETQQKFGKNPLVKWERGFLLIWKSSRFHLSHLHWTYTLHLRFWNFIIPFWLFSVFVHRIIYPWYSDLDSLETLSVLVSGFVDSNRIRKCMFQYKSNEPEFFPLFYMWIRSYEIKINKFRGSQPNNSLPLRFSAQKVLMQTNPHFVKKASFVRYLLSR